MFLMVPPKDKFAQWVHGTRLRGGICVVKKKEKQLWDIPHRDLQLFHYAQVA